MTLIPFNMDAVTNDRLVNCCRKTDGKWSLADQHLSVPFDPATGKAVLDDASDARRL